jgi:acylphosphatase
MHHVRLLIDGHVQGVGFRYFACRQAEALGLSGEVRNRPDGRVSVEAEGEHATLQRFVEALTRGPRAARVSDVDVSWSEGPSRHRGFTICG